MPEPDGRLTPNDFEIIRATLKQARPAEMGDKHPCPYCGHSNWVMGQHMVLDDIYTGRDMTMGPDKPVVPYVVFFCTRCGYTMRFNAMMFGGLFPGPSASPILRTPSTSGVIHGP